MSKPELLPLERLFVYDAVQRILHWWLALCTVGLALTGWVSSEMEPGSERSIGWLWHIFLGTLLIVGFVGRVIWGFIGPKHAQFASLFFPRIWLKSAMKPRMLPADGDFGHHPQASMSYIGFYSMVAVMVSTGVALASITRGEGPLGERLLDDFTWFEILRTVHEYTWWGIGFFVVTHIAALVLHERIEKIPLAQSMITGFQYRTRKGKRDETHT
jgi:cytochrome b